MLCFCILVAFFNFLWLEIDKISYGDIITSISTLLVGSLVAYYVSSRIEKNKLEKDILFSETRLLKNELTKLSELLKDICYGIWDLCNNSNEDLSKLLLAHIFRLDNITNQLKQHANNKIIFRKFTNFRKFINPIHDTTFEFNWKFYADFLKACTIFEESIRDLDHEAI